MTRNLKIYETSSDQSEDLEEFTLDRFRVEERERERKSASVGGDEEPFGRYKRGLRESDAHDLISRRFFILNLLITAMVHDSYYAPSFSAVDLDCPKFLQNRKCP